MSLLSQASICITPNGYKEGKLYSVIPSDGSGDMSVVRATTATRVNSAGLVELVPYNLLGYSQDFTNGVWPQNASPTITTDNLTAPNGTLTADTFSTSANASGVYQIANVAIGSTYTFSVYIKNISGATAIQIGCDFAPANGNVIYNAVTNTITTTGGGVISTSVENAGNGWYRVSGTYVSTGAINPYIVYAGTSSAMQFGVWGAQLVEGSTAKDYQKTETRLNIPRLDYSNGSCPSLLVEPQRTNVYTYSSSFDNAVWANGNATATANTTISPDGTQNADSIFEQSVNDYQIRGQLYSMTNGQAYTYTIYVKANTRNYFRILVGNGILLNFQSAYFDLVNGVTTSTSLITSSMENVGNGWYRCTATFTCNNTGTDAIYFGSSPNMTTGYSIFVGNPSNGIYAWGAQLEAGSYATSYIPTTSASVTRNADVISKTGISSLIGQTEGTIFWDIYVDTPSASLHEDLFNMDAGSYGNTIYLIKSASATFTGEMYVSNVQQATFTKTGITAGRHKIAFAYANNNTAMFFDGVQVGSTDTSCSVPATSRIQLGNGVFGPSTGWTNTAAIFKTRLTNTQLAELTTL